ncbi:MAG: hypothetical protein KatS3mg131_1213 [Candidatus Tectimicrobiota bacterium]|nr:MAG: hypothetical protein KatS3mg131_1213 [Candidatus Tectomicrobia bacterium]
MPTEKPAGRLAPIRRAQEAAPLAPITPELIVAFLDDGTPVVEEVAPHVAAWTGRPVEALRGRPLAETVEPIIPGLGVVVEEVLASGFPVRDYRLSFRDATGTPRTVLVQAGLRLRRAAALQAVVALRLEEVAAPGRHRRVAGGARLLRAGGTLGRAARRHP